VPINEVMPLFNWALNYCLHIPSFTQQTWALRSDTHFGARGHSTRQHKVHTQIHTLKRIKQGHLHDYTAHTLKSIKQGHLHSA